MKCWKKVQDSSWVLPTVVLCIYGFFANMRPAEPFLTPYMIGPYKNFTVDQVTNDLFPVWTYSYLALLFPVFMLTDILRYKPIIVIQGICLVINWILLCFAQGLRAMQYLQFNYGFVTATEVAYYSYIYSVVSSDHYQKVTSYCHSITLVGYMSGATLGQLLVSLGNIQYFYLNAITLGLVSIAFLVSFFLPMPRKSMFFNKDNTLDNSVFPSSNEGNQSVIEDGHKESLMKLGPLKILLQLLSDFKYCYSSKNLIYWSLWWSLATCGYYQVFNYTQVLWDHIQPSMNSSVYNGGVEAVTTLVGAFVSFAIGYVKLDWAVWGELALGLFSAVNSGALYLMDFTSSIWVCYTGYVIFKASYMLLITIATFQIATNLTMERYALMFGVNNFMALFLQTILTAIVVDSRGLGLDIVMQFLIYGSYYAAIAGIFLIRGIYTLLHNRFKMRTNFKIDFQTSSQDHILCSSRL
ncbi:solute carrier family 19 member 3b [Latimeria chalumnae]|uniref:solute carrier family 19 member 3b n=1 Tax=Latimeria chalumnae TaxID=7897 RepID=UPI0003C18AF0|nr:PREDICTED: thiamine transporter 2 [Latimeria chalumnae]|eukprot:XP_005993111.1 PREDICTED: thiamine transporter 2 [Latimeria chalumnae]